MSADHVLEQLRLMRAEFVVFRTYLQSIVSVLGTHTDILHEINERLLALQRQREGEA